MFSSQEVVHISGQKMKFSVLTYFSLALTLTGLLSMAKCTEDEVYVQSF